ncbi:low temperature requirement protein A [Pseudooceanicola nanhaiensis]|uniref:low temperature requirement protein A n=1 Tax=Pseudooceanicola nanhaiensis TaxID=375761 RepID=UPI001CD256E5|nr:low temperature requirement protein A [Pseudooceanicola nanhaiensis]MCA0919702.1 low temperature requirement protein A [Pseudooceanicola nanhaiensis]
MPFKDFPIWTRPRHHLDIEGGAGNHAPWVELFYDLVHVVTIFLLGNYLSHHLDWAGFWTYTFIFIAIFFARTDTRREGQWHVSNVRNLLKRVNEGLRT